VLFGALLLLAGGVVFALGSIGRPDLAAPFLPSPEASALRRPLVARGRLVATAVAVTGLLLWLWLVWRLRGGHYEEHYVWLFWASVAVIGGGLVAGRWTVGARVPLAATWSHIPRRAGILPYSQHPTSTVLPRNRRRVPLRLREADGGRGAGERSASSV
jgi:hypothetical protein